MRSVELLIIGQGPAGLSAAIYTSRAGISTMIAGCDPKVAGDYAIDNYFGFPETISGKELIERGIEQARRFGTEMECTRALSIHFEDDGTFLVKTESGEIHACAIILATGVSRKKPDIGNLADYEGRGVSYCVSCDGFFFKGKKVMVAGEGVFAANQALELMSYTPHVSVCTLGKKPAISAEFSERLAAAGISVIEKKIKELKGEQGLSQVVFADGGMMDAEGLFIAIGDASSSDFAASLGVLTKGIFIQTDEEQKTNVPGLFAAGDCTGGFLQISVAVGEGAKAARSAIEYVKQICRTR